ncbi:MAG: hypothetical protein OZ921_16150 [Sorangiineae bacterium]|nr:hypothetical protein [Polyangiaceae bacterium]MEB2324045.1 hypothetical protein [Sorangiineae bacterium]
MSERGPLSRILRTSIAATSEAMFPENDLGAPDWKSTDLVARTLSYLEELPPYNRRLVTLLFLLIELGAVLLGAGLRRFSKLPASRRTDLIRGWRRSSFEPYRMVGDSVKAVTTMMYMSHLAVVRYIEEYRACEHPLDEHRIETRAGVFDRPEHVS